MPEPPTHYQLSFTSRQALALFVGLLLALGAAYFLGLMTGLERRESANANAGAAAAVPSPEPTRPQRLAELAPSPTPIRPIRTAAIPAFPRPVLGKEPTAAKLQFFEDRPDSEATSSAGEQRSSRTVPPAAIERPAAHLTKVAPVSASQDFWVQVTSVTSEHEARVRRDRLIHKGYRARVLPGKGVKGTLYRVRVGPYPSREEAARACDRLSREEKVKAWIAPPGK